MHCLRSLPQEMFFQTVSHPKVYWPHVHTVWKHAHSSTDSSCIVTSTCKYRTNTPDNNSFEGLHSLLVCNIQEISASGTPLNTNRIRYNFVLVLILCKFEEKENHYLQYLPSRVCKSNRFVQYKCFLFHSG